MEGSSPTHHQEGKGRVGWVGRKQHAAQGARIGKGEAAMMHAGGGVCGCVGVGKGVGENYQGGIECPLNEFNLFPSHHLRREISSSIR